MKTQEFLNLLQENQNKALLFEYQEGKFVDTNYHITEVKNTIIKSVDCGGRMDEWNETVVQLWEKAEEKGKIGYMKVQKASEIFTTVHKMYAMNGDAVIKFEYSNESFHKAQLEIHNVELTASKVIVKLFITATDCKAKDVCGVPETVEVEAQNSCAPGSGCC